MNEFRVLWADWSKQHNALRDIRVKVFVEEQQVPMDEEIDEMDNHCRHVMALDGSGQAIATARLLPNHYIGRMCVLRGWRRRGVASAMMKFMIEHARSEGFGELCLNAQVSALSFYQRLGFVADSDVFVEAGIDHRHMTLNL